MRIAVLGATGLVGRTMLGLLEECAWADGEPLALASARSAGFELPWRGGVVTCRAVDAGSFAGVDFALFSAGGGPSREWAPVAAKAGAVVIDNSSAWRQDPAIPLVVPEINGALVDGMRAGIIANPNCSTIQVAQAVAPLERAWGLEEVHVTTFQAVSGAGQKAVAELARQNAGEVMGAPVFPRAIARNVIPSIGAALDVSPSRRARRPRPWRRGPGSRSPPRPTTTPRRARSMARETCMSVACGRTRTTRAPCCAGSSPTIS
jgi:aspartate-semialdehyde dehydrogenase